MDAIYYRPDKQCPDSVARYSWYIDTSGDIIRRAVIGCIRPTSGGSVPIVAGEDGRPTTSEQAPGWISNSDVRPSTPRVDAALADAKRRDPEAYRRTVYVPGEARVLDDAGQPVLRVDRWPHADDLYVDARVSHDKYGLGFVTKIDRERNTADFDFGAYGKVRLMLIGGVPLYLV
jgi:hypothetical protein